MAPASVGVTHVLIFWLQCNDGMRWVWRGRIGKCEPNSEKLGVQYGPTAAGRRSVLHPQFRRMRFALSMCPSQTHCIYIVIDKLKPATFLLDSFRLWTSNSNCLFWALISLMLGPDQREELQMPFSKINSSLNCKKLLWKRKKTMINIFREIVT